MTTDALALTTAETDRLARLETVIATGQQTFIEVGLALTTIRDNRLYRADHPTFESYLADRWPEIGRRRAYQLMDAAETAEHVNHGSQTAITNERQARALAGLTPAQQRDVVSEAGARGTLTAAAIERAAAKHKTPPDLESVGFRVRALGGSLSVSNGEYHLTIDGETRHSSQWSLIKEAVAKAEAAPAEQFNPVDHLPPLPVDLDGWRWHLGTGREGHRLFELLSPVPGILWRTGVCRTPSEAIAVARDHMMNRPALANAQDAPSAPRHTETPDRPVAPHAAPLVQPTGTLVDGVDWQAAARAAMRSLNWPPPRFEIKKEQQRLYDLGVALTAAMAVGLRIEAADAAAYLTLQIEALLPVTAPPVAIPCHSTETTENPISDVPPDSAARAAALGVLLMPVDDGCVIPYFLDEDPHAMTGMDLFELGGWLLRSAPTMAGERLADGRLTLPGIGWDTDTLATVDDYADVCAFVSDLAAADAGALDPHTIRDLGDVLEGLVAVFDDDTYTALAERVTAVQGGV